MSSSTRKFKCKNNPDSFCYICGNFTLPHQRANITDFVKRAYLAYFGIKLGDQDKSWAPHKACTICIERLRHWMKGSDSKIPFGVPMNHGTPLEDMSGPRGNSTTANPQGCMKVFIQRDYSEGTSVKFQSRFPQELEGKIDKSLFENAVNHINSLFVEAEKMSCSRYCEGCIGCITAYLIFLCIETHYEQMMKKVTKYVSEQNERIWVPRGLLLTNPVERGLRVIEISILTEPAVTRAP